MELELQAKLTGERIKFRRNQLGLSQDELANALGKSQNQIYLYEKGKALPSVEGLILLARHLQTTPDWLLGMDDESLSPIEQEAVNILRRQKNEERRQALLNALRAFGDAAV